jgi:alkaline phosphatase D
MMAAAADLEIRLGSSNTDGDGSASTRPSSTSMKSTKIAFGSCHKSKYADPQIWKTIARESPDAFVWTGDAVYPPVRGLASIELLQTEYERMRHSPAIGYSEFLSQTQIPIFGTWDDHDYGGNDMGYEMPEKERRAKAYWKFLNQTAPNPKRAGLYYSVRFTVNNTQMSDDDTDNEDTTTKQQQPAQSILVIFLDTRWHRHHHCIRSMAGTFPLGAGVACVTRWVSAGLFPQLCSRINQDPFPLLGAEQWEWLQHQLSFRDTDDPPPPPQVVVIVSSIQVTTTNPVFESWGHFPSERNRLLDLLIQTSKHSSVIILSGDVHFGEILDPFPEEPNHNTFLEITSSGLTHTCGKHVYGPVCEPLLRLFHRHRFRGTSDHENNKYYYIGRNYGTLQVDWENETVVLNVHDVSTGSIMLTTGPRSWKRPTSIPAREWNAKDIRRCMDGHLIPIAWTFLLAMGLAVWMKKRSVQSRHAPK